MPDVFDRLVGQDRAAAALRHHAVNPVHAYLLSGPAGSSLHDAALAFAAALQCPDHGCGRCEVCRRALAELDTDIYLAPRAGVSWRVDELREAERISRRRPLGAGYQIIVVENVELTTTGSAPSAPALLKSLEEAPARTIFLLTAEDLPRELETIESRCVGVRLRGLAESDLEEILTREGADASSARAAAHAAGGNLRRARVLVRDASLAARMDQWRAVPGRLGGTPASAAAVAAEISTALDAALAPLASLQAEEMARLEADAKTIGQRGVANRREIEAQFKREQRRFRTDELRFGLSALTQVYREQLTESLEGVTEGDARSSARARAAIRAVDALAQTAQRLAQNVDESLALVDLMLSLSDL